MSSDVIPEIGKNVETVEKRMKRSRKSWFAKRITHNI